MCLASSDGTRNKKVTHLGIFENMGGVLNETDTFGSYIVQNTITKCVLTMPKSALNSMTVGARDDNQDARS